MADSGFETKSKQKPELLLTDLQEHIRKGNLEKYDELKTFFYNAKTQEICGRTKKKWGEIWLFYAAFYGALLVLFLTCIGMFSIALDEIQPTNKHAMSPLKDFPGLGMRPMPDFESNLIRFVQGKPETYKVYSDHIRALLDDYENDRQQGENFIDCDRGRPPNSDDKVCRFNVDWLGDLCLWQMDYGYDEGKPCIVFKLNRIFGWLPELYTNSSEAPKDLGDRFHPDFMAVACHGLYPADIENIGNITYWPPSGFNKAYYPFLNQEGYRSPLVMIRFNNPANGVVIHVECKAFAKNVKQNSNDRLGLVRFELMVD